MSRRKTLDPREILSRSEIARVLSDLSARPRQRYPNVRQNRMIFRLACCCGLRVREVVGLDVGDVRVGELDGAGGRRPHIVVRKAVGKGKVARKVPLWLDAETLADVTAWRAERVATGAGSGDPFVCSLGKGTVGKRLSRNNAQKRWRTAIKCLGPERVGELSIHCGRHSFASHALAGGRTLPEVQRWMGHSSLATTLIYLHAVEDEGEGVGSLFMFGESKAG